jgi:hypothetical protein
LRSRWRCHRWLALLVSLHEAVEFFLYYNNAWIMI